MLIKEGNMSLQKQFEMYNKTIRLDYSVNNDLAVKRDILLDKLRQDDELDSFLHFNQGSYAMFTGIEPIDKDYDIDVGLRFNVNKDDCDILDLKKHIHKILDSHTDYGAEIKKSCVTVKYKKDGELAYHVDLVPYAYDDKDSDDKKLYLAYGKKEDTAEWKYSNPLKLKSLILERFEDDEDRKQYRRIIRYLKRWKNIVFNQTGEAEPPGIGITILAYDEFEPRTQDVLSGETDIDDLEALGSFIEKIKNRFQFDSFSQELEMLYKIIVYVPEMDQIDDNNIFRKMTVKQMTNFKGKIDALSKCISDVKEEPDIVKQCEKLQKFFGSDFKVPEVKAVSKKQHNYIANSTESGKAYE